MIASIWRLGGAAHGAAAAFGTSAEPRPSPPAPELHLEPEPEPVLRRPDRRHLGRGIARDHRRSRLHGRSGAPSSRAADASAGRRTMRRRDALGGRGTCRKRVQRWVGHVPGRAGKSRASPDGRRSPPAAVRKGLPIVAYLVFGVSALVILRSAACSLVTLSIATRNTVELLEDKCRAPAHQRGQQVALFLEPAQAQVEALAAADRGGRARPGRPRASVHGVQAGPRRQPAGPARSCSSTRRAG